MKIILRSMAMGAVILFFFTIIIVMIKEYGISTLVISLTALVSLPLISVAIGYPTLKYLENKGLLSKE